MHRSKLLTLSILLILSTSLSIDSVNSFQPNPEDDVVFIGLLASERREVLVGTIIDIYIVIKNFANFTMSDVLINQTVQEVNGLIIVESPLGTFNGTDRTYTEPVSVMNYATSNNVTLTGFNVTSSSFTMAMDEINPGDELTFKFKINNTQATLGEVLRPTLNYVDQYGDPQTELSSENNVEIQSEPIPDCPLCPYFPEVEVKDTEPNIILIIGFLLLLVALLSRGLYNKRPIE